MKKVFVKQLNQCIEFDTSIKVLKFNDVKNYREFVFNIYDSLIFSIDNVEKPVDSCGLIIKNPFEIDLNEKKLITSIYKRMQSQFTDEQLGYIQKIEEYSFKLFDELLEEQEYHLEYNESVDIVKLFSNYNISFPVIEYDNYLELFFTYCKLNAMYNKTKIVISFGVSNLLTEKELELLKIDLELNDLVLLDIMFNNKFNSKNDLIIDDDWCII